MKTFCSVLLTAVMACGLTCCNRAKTTAVTAPDSTRDTTAVTAPACPPVPTPVPVKSLKFVDSCASVSLCSLKVDFPTGRDSFSMAVARYVSSQLRECCSESSSKLRAYKGDMTNGRSMLSYYGKGCMKLLKGDGTCDDPDYSSEFTAELRKIDDNERYVNYSTQGYMYLGGAHGSSFYYVATLVKPSGKILRHTVDSTKVKQMQPLLRKGVLQYFREMGDNSVTASNLNSSLFIENGIIPLPASTPYLSDKGLVFTYQQYEIACYAAGMPSFVIPYNKVKPFMTPEARALIK